MAKYIKKSKSKSTGGKRKAFRKKKKYHTVPDSQVTRLGPQKIKVKRAKSGNVKNSLLFSDLANVLTDKGVKKSQILDVIHNKSNRHFVRQDVITKGAVIKTKAGLAKVTSRPGQDGVVNAVLIEK